MKFLQGSAWYWEDEKPQELGRLEFKPDVIREFISQTAAHETEWLELFQELNVQPYIVIYVDFINAYEDTAKEISKYLGIPHPDQLVFGHRRNKKASRCPHR